MIINNVVLAGNLTADAAIIECPERVGRFKVDFRMAVNQTKKQGVTTSVSERATFITVKLFVSENAALFFASKLYKGREVVVTGSLASHTSLAPGGSSSTTIYIEARSCEVVPEENERRTEEPGTEMIDEAPAKPVPRQFHVQRPGQPVPTTQQAPSPAIKREHQTAPPSTPAQLYRDKGVSDAPVTVANADDLCRW
nr:single-stranded DNA-binding protein [Stenotrophomonas pavanii]